MDTAAATLDSDIMSQAHRRFLKKVEQLEATIDSLHTRHRESLKNLHAEIQRLQNTNSDLLLHSTFKESTAIIESHESQIAELNSRVTELSLLNDSKDEEITRLKDTISNFNSLLSALSISLTAAVNTTSETERSTGQSIETVVSYHDSENATSDAPKKPTSQIPLIPQNTSFSPHRALPPVARKETPVRPIDETEVLDTSHQTKHCNDYLLPIQPTPPKSNARTLSIRKLRPNMASLQSNLSTTLPHLDTEVPALIQTPIPPSTARCRTGHLSRSYSLPLQVFQPDTIPRCATETSSSRPQTGEANGRDEYSSDTSLLILPPIDQIKLSSQKSDWQGTIHADSGILFDMKHPDTEHGQIDVFNSSDFENTGKSCI